MKYLFIIAYLIGGCGGNETEREYVPVPPGTNPNPGTIPEPQPGNTYLTTIKPLLEESCGGGSCHGGAGFLQNEADLRGNSQVQKRIQSDSMPPSFSGKYFLWEDGQRKKDVLEFLSN